MTAASASTMRRDIASAYLASACKIGSWVVISAVVYRFLGPAEFAVLVLIRGTIGLLNYLTLGLAPALIHETSHAERLSEEQGDPPPTGGAVLTYFSQAANEPLRLVYSNGLEVALGACASGAILTAVFAATFHRIFLIPVFVTQLPLVVFNMGLGTLIRLLGDAPGAVLQVRGKIAFDNLLVASGDLLWVLFVFVPPAYRGSSISLVQIAAFYTLGGGIAFLLRFLTVGVETGIYQPRSSLRRWRILRSLLSYGGLVMLAQIADYLYAPTDYILINRLLDPVEVAFYAPAVQIDAGLLLLVTGLSAVMLPKAALAHAGGETSKVRQYYVRGTLASVMLLAIASLVVWLLSPWIFRIWFGNSMPVTRSILPIVLVVTVVGGSSAIGRSILLAVGHVKPFTIAVLIAGVTNVVCSYAFVRWLHLGLKGIVLGTVVAVVGRCVIWMPWYVLRTLRTTPVGSPTADFPPNLPL